MKRYIFLGLIILILLLVGVWYAYAPVQENPDVTSEVPHVQTVIGCWECLPPKDKTGPHTMECAFGIAADQSDGHYAISTSLMSTYPVDYAVGTKVKVTGLLVPVEQLSSIQKYDIDGVIEATVIEEIK